MERSKYWFMLGGILGMLLTPTSFATTTSTDKAFKSQHHHAARVKHERHPVKLTPAQEQLKQKFMAQLLPRIQSTKVNRPILYALGLYDSFKFNSTTGNLYNRFYGHTELLNLGGENLYVHGFVTGLTVTAANTRLHSNASPAIYNYQLSNTSIDNTAINAHVMRPLSRNFNVDILGGVGQSQFSLNNTVIFPTTDGEAINENLKYGTGHLWGFNEYLGGRFTAIQSFNKITLQGDAGYIFSNFQQPAYNIYYDDGSLSHVLSLITRIGMLTENARLMYQVNDHLQPYLMAGLIQVASLTYSNPITQTATVSPLPQQTISNSGFLLGAGLSYQNKNIRLSPIYQFSQRGTNYVDNLGALKIDLIL